MMNGTKKSDSSIVPAKPANKAERSTAELVEGDDGTKRNAELQSTVRTQGREAVTQAQARIRGAVTRNEEKLTALLHHVSTDVLRWAFFNIKKQAAPGVDGLTWVDYAGAFEVKHMFYPTLYFLHSSFFVRLGIPFLRPDPHMLRPTRPGPVKVGRRSALAARSVVSRPRLDRHEHGGHAGCGRDDDQRGSLPSGAIIAPQPCIR